MKQLIALILCFLFIAAAFTPPTASAQTEGWHQLPGPQVSGIQQIEIATDGTKYVITTTGEFYKTKGNEGSTVLMLPQSFYSQQNQSHIENFRINLDKQNNIYAFTTLSSQNIEQGIFRSIDQGKTWTKVCTASFISKICISNSGKLFAYQSSFEQPRTIIFMSSNQGLNWDTLSSIALTSFDFTINDSDQCFLTISDGYLAMIRFDVYTKLYKLFTAVPAAISDSATLLYCKGKVIVRSKNEFFTESNGDLKRIGTGFTHSKTNGSIICNSSGNIYVDILTHDSIPSYLLYYSSNTGISWNNIAVLQQNKSLCLAFDSAGTMLSGSLDTLDKGLYATTDNAKHWQKINIANGYASMIIKGPESSIISKFLFKKNPKTQIYKSYDHGENWINIDSLFTLFSNTNIYFLPFYNSNWYILQPGYGTFRNEDEPFTFVKESNISFTPLSAVSWKNKLYVRSAETGGDIQATTDGGISWDRLPIPITTTPCNALEIDSSGSLYVGFTPALYRSDDGGKNWVKLITNIRLTSINSIKAVGKNTIIFSTSSQGIWRSDDRGQQWRKWSPVGQDTIRSIDIAGDRCFANTAYGIIACDLNSDSWDKELFIDEQIAVDKIYSIDGKIYAAIPYGGIWVSDTTYLASAIIEKELPSVDIFDGTTSEAITSIRFSLQEQTSLEIILYDILGHIIYKEPNKSYPFGVHSITIPTNSLTNGMYFIAVVTDKESKSAKLIINR